VDVAEKVLKVRGQRSNVRVITRPVNL